MLDIGHSERSLEIQIEALVKALLLHLWRVLVRRHCHHHGLQVLHQHVELLLSFVNHVYEVVALEYLRNLLASVMAVHHRHVQVHNHKFVDWPRTTFVLALRV